MADILIVALGKPEFVTADMVKEGAVVIDVGIHRIDDASKKSGFRLLGDVKFDEVAPKTTAITPVPRWGRTDDKSSTPDEYIACG